MNLQKIKYIKKENIFKGHSSLKEWNLKNLEGFLIKDAFYFNEYGKVEAENITKEFIKKNKKKGLLLYDIIKKGDISLNSTGHIAAASWLGFTLDKISFISLGYRRSIKMIRIITDDNTSITLTKNKRLLTNCGYLEASKIEKGTELVGIIGNSYNGFKKGGGKKDFIDIYELLTNIKNIIVSKKSKEVKIKSLEKNLIEYLNILGIKTSKEIITLQDINILLNALEKKGNEEDLNSILIQNKTEDGEYKNFFSRKVKEIKEIEVKNAYIGSVISKLAENCIINNIILEK